MKVKYYQKDDIFIIKFTNKLVDDSYELDSAILEVDKNNKPVSLEILHASSFFSLALKQLPKEIKTKYFASI